MAKQKYELTDLDGPNDNTFATIGYVQKCMKAEGKAKEELKAYYDEATEDDYDRLVYVSKQMLNELNNPEK